MRYLSDTSPDAQRVLTEIYRNMSPAQKWRRLGELYRTAKQLHAAGVRDRRPNAGAQDIQIDWLSMTLDEDQKAQVMEAAGGASR